MRIFSLLLIAAVLAIAPFLPHGRSAHAKATDWAKKLASNDANDVYNTVREIERRQDIAGGLPLLLTAVKTKHPHIAVACGEALAHMKPEEVDAKLLKDSKFKKAFKKLIGSKEAGEQKNMARLLGVWSHPFVDPHLAHLASGRRSPEVQAEALFMCGSIRESKKQRFEKTREAIGKALKGRSGAIQAAACSAAGRRQLRVFMAETISVVKRSRDRYAGLYGVWALKQMGYVGGVTSFIHVATKGPKRTTLNANLKAITELSTLRDIDELLALTKSSNKDLRDAATLALGRMPWRVWHRKKRDLKRKIEAGGITPSGGVPVAPKKKGLPDPQLTVPDKVIDRLIDLVQHDADWEVRDAARQGLLRFGKRAQAKVQTQLPHTVDSSDYDTALTAMELCGLFGAKSAYKSLIRIVRNDKDLTRRMFAARALEGVGPEKAVQELTQDLKPRKRAKDTELYAIRALGYIRTDAAYDWLVAQLLSEDYSKEVLREVEFSLERLTGHRFGRKPDRWAAWKAKTTKPYDPRVKEFDRQENRREAVKKKLFGLTETTERTVENGLRWLELQQGEMGEWDGNEKGFGGVVNCEPAYTGLQLLAFVGAGYNGAEGKYRETIRRASEFLAATQFYDGGFPVTGGGDDGWIFAYLIGMGVWGITESYGLSGEDLLAEPAQWGVDYLVRTQTSGAGWRYSARAYQSDTSCTSWVLMTTKMADLIGLDVAQRSWDGVDSWLERCSFDMTGEEEVPKDLSTDYDYEVGHRRYFKSFTGYLTLSGSEKTALRAVSMSSVGMVCRFFMGWKRSHPYMIGCANFLMDFQPRWMAGLEKQNARWYFYYWYYGTMAMHQMGGKYWRNWNDKIRRILTKHQVQSPESLRGSWQPDSVRFGGGRLLSTPLAIMTLETYYRFSPLMGKPPAEEEDEADPKEADAKKLPKK